METWGILEFIEWFRKHYSKKDYAFAMREFQAECIIKEEKRYKVVDIYPQKIEEFYFIVYKKIPIKESFKKNTYIKDNVFEEHHVYF